MADELIKPNSDNYRSEKQKKEEVLKTSKATVKTRRSFREFISTFYESKRDSFLWHVIFGILAPRTLDMADDILKDGIDHVLHPKDTQYRSDYRRERRTYDGVSYRAYDGMYESPGNSKKYEPERYDRTPDPRTIEFNDRQQANMVLEDMKMAIYEERFCTIQQFYEFAKRHAGVNIIPNWTDENYGWSNLDGVRPDMSYNGKFILRLPRTERL